MNFNAIEMESKDKAEKREENGKRKGREGKLGLDFNNVPFQLQPLSGRYRNLPDSRLLRMAPHSWVHF